MTPLDNALSLLNDNATTPAAAPASSNLDSALSLLNANGAPTIKPIKQYSVGISGFPQAAKDVAGDFHPLLQAAVGTKAAVDNAILRLKQLVLAGGAGMAPVQGTTPADLAQLSPQDQNAVTINRGLRGASPMTQLGGVAGDVGMTLPLSGLYGAGRTAAAMVPGMPGFLAPSVGAGLLGGTASALTEPKLPGESSSIGPGAAGAIAADALTRGAGRVVQPITQSPAVQRLLASNVIPTPGQAAGGLVNDIEQKLTSLPGTGYVINRAVNRGVQDVNRAGLSAGGVPIKSVGNAGIEESRSTLGQAYDSIYQNKVAGRDAALVQDLKNAVLAPTIPLSKTYKNAYDRVIQKTVLDRLPPGETFPAADIKKQIESDLGAEIRKYGPMPSGQDNSFVQALKQARESVRSMLARNIGPDASKLADVNRAYANMKDMEQASKAALARGGVATPYQILRAAAPNTPLSRLASDAQTVMGNRVPDSGTAGRALMDALFTKPGLAATMGAPYLAPLLASPLLYSRLGTRALLGDLPGQSAVAQAFRANAPLSSLTGAALAR